MVCIVGGEADRSLAIVDSQIKTTVGERRGRGQAITADSQITIANLEGPACGVLTNGESLDVAIGDNQSVLGNVDGSHLAKAITEGRTYRERIVAIDDNHRVTRRQLIDRTNE